MCVVVKNYNVVPQKHVSHNVILLSEENVFFFVVKRKRKENKLEETERMIISFL